MAKNTKPIFVSMYDPARDAFRDITIETAKKFIASAKKVEEQIREIESEEE